MRSTGDRERPERERGTASLREIGTVRERDDVTAETNKDVKEVYWYSAEIVFSNLGFHLGFFFFLPHGTRVC